MEEKWYDKYEVKPPKRKIDWNKVVNIVGTAIGVLGLITLWIWLGSHA